MLLLRNIIVEINKVIEKIAHTEETISGKAATCTESGTDIYACDDCDFTEKRTINAIGHTLSEWKVEVKATKDKEGLEVRPCNNYNCDFKEENITPKLSSATESDDDNDIIYNYYITLLS